MDNPRLENRPQLNKDKRNTDLLNMERIKSYRPAARPETHAPLQDHPGRVPGLPEAAAHTGERTHPRMA